MNHFLPMKLQSLISFRFRKNSFTLTDLSFYLLLYLLIFSLSIVKDLRALSAARRRSILKKTEGKHELIPFNASCKRRTSLQKGGVPATPSGTATLLRLSPNHLFRPRPLLPVTDFRRPRLSWLDGRCVQGPGTYSPRHG